MIYHIGPRARRVYDALRARIVGGELALGAQLPSYVALAAQFGVAPLTVRQVLAQLEQEGLVSREQGRGTYVRAVTVPPGPPGGRASPVGRPGRRSGR